MSKRRKRTTRREPALADAALIEAIEESKAAEQVVIEPPAPMNPYEGFDAARSVVAGSLATMTSAVKVPLNQLLAWMEKQEDERWDPIFENLDKANQDFNTLYRSLGRVLGTLDPGHIETEAE